MLLPREIRDIVYRYHFGHDNRHQRYEVFPENLPLILPIGNICDTSRMRSRTREIFYTNRQIQFEAIQAYIQGNTAVIERQFEAYYLEDCLYSYPVTCRWTVVHCLQLWSFDLCRYRAKDFTLDFRKNIYLDVLQHCHNIRRLELMFLSSAIWRAQTSKVLMGEFHLDAVIRCETLREPQLDMFFHDGELGNVPALRDFGLFVKDYLLRKVWSLRLVIVSGRDWNQLKQTRFSKQ
jgi:hypothetical protein